MQLLQELQAIPGPSGDEGAIADFVELRCREIAGAEVRRIGDLVLAVRGTPRVAVLAHIDTIGFTLGYGRKLIRIGNPYVEGNEKLREVGGEGRGRLKLVQVGSQTEWRLSGQDGKPGSRWVYAAPLVLKNDKVSGPYLDNRAGVWNAFRVLERCEDVLVAFTPGEEHHARGALLAARILHEEFRITRALISDITWHTDWIKCGKGPAVSYRDSSLPRQHYLEMVLAAATASGVPFQHEIESSGGSDGGIMDRAGYPIDWVFVGAPETRTHTPREQCVVADLYAMVDLYAFLVPALTSLP